MYFDLDDRARVFRRDSNMDHLYPSGSILRVPTVSSSCTIYDEWRLWNGQVTIFVWNQKTTVVRVQRLAPPRPSRNKKQLLCRRALGSHDDD
jgi:hypothetical protein